MPESRTRGPLRINPTPFKPTLLSIPPSPISPRTPLTPLAPPKASSSHRTDTTDLYNYPQPASDAPSPPLSWVWQCHQCHRSYHLSVTRRCLEDGHHFCAGTTTLKAWRKPAQQRRTKRHRACASEFDYQGWKTWGRWRRGRTRQSAPKGRPERRKDCWNACDYPSECRWGRRFGVHTPVVTTFEVPAVAPPPPPPDHPEEGVLKPENVKVELEQDKADFWGALIASAKRRKSETPSSPLATVSEESEGEEKDGDGDTIMSSSDPDTSLSSEQDSPASSAAADMLNDLMKRNTTRQGRLGPQHSYAVPMLTVPKSVLAKDEDQVSLSDPEAFLEGFAPLERVASRKDGGVVGGV